MQYESSRCQSFGHGHPATPARAGVSPRPDSPVVDTRPLEEERDPFSSFALALLCQIGSGKWGRISALARTSSASRLAGVGVFARTARRAPAELAGQRHGPLAERNRRSDKVVLSDRERQVGPYLRPCSNILGVPPCRRRRFHANGKADACGTRRAETRPTCRTERRSDKVAMADRERRVGPYLRPCSNILGVPPCRRRRLSRERQGGRLRNSPGRDTAHLPNGTGDLTK